MAEILLVHFAPPRIGVLEVSATKGKVQIRRGWAGSLPDELADGAEPDRIGIWLKDQLRTQNFRTRTATLILPREELAVRRLELPPARDEELAAMVQLQAATVQSAERMLMDFVPFPASSPEAGRHVLTAAIPRLRAQKLERMIQQAGLELEAIRISSTALAEVTVREEMRRGLAPDEASLTISVGEDQVEMVVVDRRGLAMAHAAESDQPQRVAAEVSRLLVTCAPILAERRIARVWLVGADGQGALAEAVGGRLGVTPIELDPASDPHVQTLVEGELPADIRAVGAGTAWALADPVVPSADLLHPRQPPVEKSHGRRRGVLIAAGLALLVAVVFGMTRLQQADVSRQIRERQKVLADLDQVLNRGKPTNTAAAVVGDWDHRRVNWLTQLVRLKSLLPDARQLYLVNLRVDPSVGDAVARVRAGGLAKDRETVEALFARVSESGFVLYPQTIDYTPDNRDYPYRFELHVELPAAPASPQSAPARPPSPAVAARQGD